MYIIPLLKEVSPDYVAFLCPGCGDSHVVKVKGDRAWGYNGNPAAPTFTPSYLIRSGHFASGHSAGEDGCWCKFNAERAAKGKEPSGFECRICHSFVTDGRIHFLGDCTHHLAGQTVDLPEWPREEA
jgi:hypothetical protein